LVSFLYWRSSPAELLRESEQTRLFVVAAENNFAAFYIVQLTEPLKYNILGT
jgi:hypothetical protein